MSAGTQATAHARWLCFRAWDHPALRCREVVPWEALALARPAVVAKAHEVERPGRAHANPAEGRGEKVVDARDELVDRPLRPVDADIAQVARPLTVTLPAFIV